MLDRTTGLFNKQALVMTPRERDPSLPTLPENSEAKLSSDWSKYIFDC